MRIAVIGTGTVGRTLGEGLAKAGHDVVVGTRDPANSGPRRVAGDIAITGQLWRGRCWCGALRQRHQRAASLEALQAVGDEALAGKVLIDVSNALDHPVASRQRFLSPTPTRWPSNCNAPFPVRR